jgi:TRAP-type mannitol/chloroaromatic compound transport system substrate-binding protein
VLKHYYLEGLHQVVVNADLYINGDVWKSLSPTQQKAVEVAANASLMKTVAYRIHENGIALKELTEKHGVILHDTPPAYFKEYGDAAMKNFEKNAAANPFFKKVWDSQKAWAATAIPYWARAQKTNAAMGGAYAEVLKKGAAPAAAQKAEPKADSKTAPKK